jgi:hypothetical protein
MNLKMSDVHQKYLRELISKIKRLTVKEKYHILSIFKKYEIEFTKNSNGYFFNLDKIDESILEKVSKCVDLIEQKRELIYTLDQKRDSYLEYYKNLIENKLKETINKRRNKYINQLILVPSETYIKKKQTKFIRKVNIVDDPDLLMKEYNKSKKYHKNSVYFRLNQRLTLLSRKSHKHTQHDRREKDESVLNNDDGGEGDEGGDGDEGGEIDGDMDGLEQELEESIGEEYIDTNDKNSVSDIEYGENHESEDVGDDEYYKDITTDTETNTEYKTEKTDRTENKTKATKKGRKKRKDLEASSHEIDYYKNLLKMSGFKFDDDKCVVIKLEEYID